MPIIPRADESQVLNAGSPVPLKTGDSGSEIYAKALGRVSEQVGTLLMRQGAAIDAADKAAQKERAKADSENAQTDFLIGLTEIEDNLRRSDEYGNMSTTELMKKYREESSKLSDSYSSGLMDEFTRANFDQESAKITAQRALLFHTEALKDYNKVTSNKLDSYVSKRASMVSLATSNKELTENIAAVTARIQSNDVLTSTEKDVKVAAARKELMSAYMNGHISRIIQSDSIYERDVIAKKALRELDIADSSAEGLTANITGILDEEEKNKFRNRITDTVYNANGRDLQRQNALEAMDKRHTKAKHQDTFRELYVEGINMVTDDVTYEIFQEKVRDKARRGMIDPTKIDELEKGAMNALGRKRSGLGGGEVSDEQSARDDKYREEIYSKAFTVNNPLVLSEGTYDAMKSRGISASASVEVQAELETLSNAYRKDPGLKARVSSSIQEFDNLANNPSMRQFSREQQLKATDAINKAKMSLYKAVLTNPKLDVKNTADDFYKVNVKPVLDSFMPATQGPVDKKAIMEEVRVLNAEYFKLKKEGRLTPDIQKDYANKLKNLKLKMGSDK